MNNGGLDGLDLPRTLLDLEQSRMWRPSLEAAREKLEWLEKLADWHELEYALGQKPWVDVRAVEASVDWVDSWNDNAGFLSLFFSDGSKWTESLGASEDRQCFCGRPTHGGVVVSHARSREAEKLLGALRLALDRVGGGDWEEELERRGAMPLDAKSMKELMFTKQELARWEADLLESESLEPLPRLGRPKSL
jgi:hypothetical protein